MLAVNGVQFRPSDPSHLHFDKSFNASTFARVPINATTGAQTGPVETILDHATYLTNRGFAGDDLLSTAPGGMPGWLRTLLTAWLEWTS